jgi:replicative DNA helicase
MSTNSVDRLRGVLHKLKPLLPDYLARHGHPVDAKGVFQCINPNHPDAHPSARIVPNSGNQAFVCFSCGVRGDVLSAAHLLEGKPTHGKTFLTETIFPLAASFGLVFEKFELEDTESHQTDIVRAYTLAGNILESSTNEGPLSELYGWKLLEVRAVEPHIGTIAWEDFAGKMRDLGDYTQVYLESIGLKAALFDSHLLTFGIRNAGGRLVGFAARSTKVVGKGRAWRNTSGDIELYKKGSLLYGLDTAGPGSLHLFEGYSDVIAFRLQGFSNCVAYMSSAPSAEQLELLRKHKRFDIALVPDNDTNRAGAESTIRTLDTIILRRGEFRVRIKVLPSPAVGTDSLDPRDYLKNHTIDEYRHLDEVDAFEWRLHQFDKAINAEEITQKILPIITEEKDPIRRDSKLRLLSIKTGVRLKSLEEALDTAMEEKRAEVKKRAREEVAKVREELEHASLEQAPELLRRAAIRIEEARDIRFRKGLHGTQETLSFLQDLKREFSTRGSSLPGWETGLRTLDDSLGGIPRKECMLVIAADGNAGKSALVQNIGLQVATRNPDVSVLLYSIDDTRSQVIPRLVSQITGIPINTVAQPDRYQLTSAQILSIDAAWHHIQKLIEEGRFDIKDASHAATIAFADSWIDSVRNEYPDRGILFMLDNFHRLRGLPGEGERERLEAASDAVFMLTKQKAITALCTMELRKRQYPNKRPKLEDLKGSKRFEYDASVIAMGHNPMHADRGNADADYWMDGDTAKPIVQLYFDKNKVTSFKGMLRFRFRPETSQILEPTDTKPGEQVPEIPDAVETMEHAQPLP